MRNQNRKKKPKHMTKPKYKICPLYKVCSFKSRNMIKTTMPKISPPEKLMVYYPLLKFWFWDF